MTPQKWVLGVVINEEASSSTAKVKKLPPNRGKGKGKLTIAETPKSNTVGERLMILKLHSLSLRMTTYCTPQRVEICSKACHDLSRIL